MQLRNFVVTANSNIGFVSFANHEALVRGLFGVVLCLILISCSARGTAGLPESLPKGFNHELENIGLNQCEWSAVSISRGQFNGIFIPADEHTPNRVRVGRNRYDAILSNDLSMEFFSSVDGTGGARFSDAVRNLSRKAVQGYLVDAKIHCPKNQHASQNRKFIFLINYGSAI